MRYESIFTAGNGKECLIRALTREDGQITLDNFNKTRRESAELLAAYADETSFTAEQEAEILDTWLQSDTDMQIGAFVDGILVGMACIHPLGRRDKVKHRCDFGISILQAYQGLHIGRALTEACIRCAVTAGYTQIELDVVSTNEKAVALYKKLGFTEYGRNTRGFRTREGNYQTLILMKKEI